MPVLLFDFLGREIYRQIKAYTILPTQLQQPEKKCWERCEIPFHALFFGQQALCVGNCKLYVRLGLILQTGILLVDDKTYFSSSITELLKACI